MSKSKVAKEIISALRKELEFQAAEIGRPRAIDTLLAQRRMGLNTPPPSSTGSSHAVKLTMGQYQKEEDGANDTVVATQQERTSALINTLFGPNINSPTAQDIENGNEVLAYLRSQRTYKTLLDRYNPTASMDELERIRLTANRVGLELPKQIQDRFDNDTEATEKDKKDNDDDDKGDKGGSSS